MKKVNIIIAILAAVLMMGCTSQKNPKAVVRAYFNAIEDEEFFDAATYCLPTEQINYDAKANTLRQKYGKVVRAYRIIGIEQLNDSTAVVAVKVKPEASALIGDIIELIDVAKMNDQWYIGKRPAPIDYSNFGWSEDDLEQMMQDAEMEEEDGEEEAVNAEIDDEPEMEE